MNTGSSPSPVAVAVAVAVAVSAWTTLVNDFTTRSGTSRGGHGIAVASLGAALQVLDRGAGCDGPRHGSG